MITDMFFKDVELVTNEEGLSNLLVRVEGKTDLKKGDVFYFESTDPRLVFKGQVAVQKIDEWEGIDNKIITLCSIGKPDVLGRDILGAFAKQALQKTRDALTRIREENDL